MGPSEPKRLIYASPNGDRWHLLRAPATGLSFVRHTGNMASGGHVTDFSLATFLTSGRNGPEHQALRRLISPLVGAAGPRHP